MDANFGSDGKKTIIIKRYKRQKIWEGNIERRKYSSIDGIVGHSNCLSTEQKNSNGGRFPLQLTQISLCHLPLY